MKKLLLYFTLAATITTAQAQKTDHSFLLPSDVANSQALLPAPPNDESAQFQYDKYRYFWGKSLRNTPRGEMAYRDCDSGPEGMARAFSETFGTTISREATPEIFKLMAFVNDDAGWYGTDQCKLHYRRIRPYRYFDEPTCKPEDERGLQDNGSYPSGHTAGGFAIALVLAEINIDNQTALLQRGYAFGESRVICGYHWQSDVDGGYLIAAGVVARLHADDGFAQQLTKAKQEFQNLKAQGKVKHVPTMPAIE